MERKVALFIATSLDGYIATVEDSLEWLFNVEGEGDSGYSEFYETVDTIILGRRTYDWIMEHENGNFPYKNKQCYVFSENISGQTEFVQFVNEDVAQFTKFLKDKPGGKIWIVGGGKLLQDFVKENLIDEYLITVAPSIIGDGIPLFKQGDYEVDLILRDVKQYNQFVQLTYEKK
ncbi:dihydrofolate reductase [Bacillus sp. BGMRC 2118]|nr:dihydrofolate reductase [Bacillus sp. BGMRC 2118]